MTKIEKVLHGSLPVMFVNIISSTACTTLGLLKQLQCFKGLLMEDFYVFSVVARQS